MNCRRGGYSFIFLLIGFARVVFAEIILSGGETPLVTAVPGHQSNPTFWMWDDVNFLIWENTGTNGVTGIVGSSISSGNTGKKSLFQISSEAGNNPQACVVNEETSVVVWDAGPRGNKDVYLVLIDKNGVRAGPQIRVNDFIEGNQWYPSVCVTQNQSIFVTWQSDRQDGDGSGVYGQLISNNGLKLGKEFQVNQRTELAQFSPIVVAQENGGVLVIWVSQVQRGNNSAGGKNLKSNIKGRFFLGGKAQGDEFLIGSRDIIAKSPHAAVAQDGRIHVVWGQCSQPNSSQRYDIWGAVIDGKTGIPDGDSFQINEFMDGLQDNPKVICHKTHVFHIWESFGQDFGGWGIVGRKYPAGREFVINSQRNLNQRGPSLGVDKNGRVVVVWANTIRSDYSIISGQEFVLEGQELPPVIAQSSQTTSEYRDPVKSDLLGPATFLDLSKTSAQIMGEVTPKAAVPFPAFPESQLKPIRESEGSLAAQPRQGAPPRNTLGKVPAQLMSVNQFPVRGVSQQNLRSGIKPIGTVASNAIRNMANRPPPVRRSVAGVAMSNSQAPHLRSIPRSGYVSGKNSSTSLSRATLLGRFNSSGSRNQAGVSPAKVNVERQGLSTVNEMSRIQPFSRSGLMNNRPEKSQNSSQSQSAQYRANAIRMRTQQVESNAVSAGEIEVPAGLRKGPDGKYNLQWVSERGMRYQIQGSDDQSLWHNHGGTLQGNGRASLAPLSGSFRYYRIIRAK